MRPTINAQPDIAQRTMLEALALPPYAIYRMIRMVKGGPICPAAIYWAQTTHEPGNPENRMIRSRQLVGYIGFLPIAAPERIIMAGGAGSETIDRRRYEREMTALRRDWVANRYNPRFHPFRPVRIEALPLPFPAPATRKE